MNGATSLYQAALDKEAEWREGRGAVVQWHTFRYRKFMASDNLCWRNGAKNECNAYV